MVHTRGGRRLSSVDEATSTPGSSSSSSVPGPSRSKSCSPNPIIPSGNVQAQSIIYGDASSDDEGSLTDGSAGWQYKDGRSSEDDDVLLGINTESPLLPEESGPGGEQVAELSSPHQPEAPERQ